MFCALDTCSAFPNFRLPTKPDAVMRTRGTKEMVQPCSLYLRVISLVGLTVRFLGHRRRPELRFPLTGRSTRFGYRQTTRLKR